jgi:hypothetical protein
VFFNRPVAILNYVQMCSFDRSTAILNDVQMCSFDRSTAILNDVQMCSFDRSTFSLSVGHATAPKTLPSRLVYLTVYITAVVLTTSYAAIFISFLAVRRYELPFEDFQGLLRDGSYRLGLNRATGHMSSFQVHV